MRPVVATLSWLIVAAAAAAQSEWIEKTYEPSTEVMANPERGLYVELADRRQRPLDNERLQELADDGITLVQRLYYLKGYRDRPLDEVQLDLIASDFETLREASMKAILRFAYSSRIGEPDAPMDIVLGHIEQLRPLLQENADLILTVQAGFIGAWGEWHASTNGLTEPAAMRRIATALLDALPSDRTIQVRTPVQKRRLLGDGPPLTIDSLQRGSLAARIGHHNDCFLADTTDVGTYRERHLEADRAYVAADSLFTPVGGETCRNGSRSDPAFAREELARMHWSFLNLAYHRGVIAKWRESGFLDEVRRQLGYRLRLVSVRLPRSVSPGSGFSARLLVANDGWAAPIHNRPVELLLVDAEGGIALRVPAPIDLRDSLPGKRSVWDFESELPAGLTPGSYAVEVRLPDPSRRLADDPRYSLRLANVAESRAIAGSNDLDVNIVVATAAR